MTKRHSDKRDRYTIQVIGRAMDLIDVLSKKPQGLTLDEFSSMLSLHRATVYRILTTLEQEGIVERTAERPITYVLGLRCLSLGVRMLSEKTVMPKTQAVLEAVSLSTGECVGLFMRWGNERACVASSGGMYPPQYRIRIGDSASLCSGSSGKLLLAYMPYEDAKSILRETLPLIRRYPGTKSEVEVVLEELDTIRSKGFAVSEREMSCDAKSVAVPVLNHDNSVIAALGLIAKAERMPDSKLPELVSQLRNASRRLQRLSC